MTTSPESTPATPPPKPEALLLEVIRENEVQGTELATLNGTFMPMLAEAEKWAQIVATINITDVGQVREMKMARETRLALREVRVNADKKRKALKENALRYGRAVDGAFNIIKFLTEPLEEKLLEQEKFAERQEQVRIDALRVEREEKLRAYGVDVSLYQLGLMPQEAFDSLLEGQRLAAEAKEKERQRVESEKIAVENARLIEEKRVRDENERLRKEAADRAEADRQKAVETARIAREQAEREAADRMARQERKASREAKLAPYEFDSTFTPLGDMSDGEFSALLAQAATDHGIRAQQRKEAEAVRRAHEQALADERKKADEQLAAQKAETERVAKEALDRETAAKAERDRAAEVARKEQADRDAKAKAEKDAADAKADQERQARETAEQALAEARDREAKRLADEEAARQRAAAAPDKEKIESFRVALSQVILLPMETDAAKTVAAAIVTQHKKFNDWLVAQIAKL